MNGNLAVKGARTPIGKRFRTTIQGGEITGIVVENVDERSGQEMSKVF